MNIYTERTTEAIEETLPSFKFVKIDKDKLIAVAEKNALNDFALPRWDLEGCQPLSNLAFPSHCLVWNAINFCYDHSSRNGDGKLKKFRAWRIGGHGWKPMEMSGAYAMSACVYRLFRENRIYARELLPFLETLSGFKKAFRGYNMTMPLIGERREFLTEVAGVLENRFDGDVMNLIKEGGYRAFGRGKNLGIVEILISSFPKTFGGDWYLDDRGFFNPPGKLFFFAKRAQLFVLEYHGRAMQSCGELKPIEDIADLGPIADYELPKSYAAEEILNYHPSLQLAIDGAEAIAPRSQQEVEIRSAFVWTHIKELSVINAIRERNVLSPIHVGHLDYYRWQKGRKNKALNHHLCFTTDY